MAGTHDFDLLLRDRLVHYMETNNNALKKAWKTERMRTDKLYGIESEAPKLDTVSQMISLVSSMRFVMLSLGMGGDP